MREIIVDNFAGGGGASTGIEAALGVHVDEAINHDPIALAMHAANHPGTRHHVQNICSVDPRDVTLGRPVGLAWFSPDCKHHSKAMGGKPREKNIRDLAWVVPHWAEHVRPRVIILENVEEFRHWGPLLENGKPCPIQKGLEFLRWVKEIEKRGYRVEWRELRACDYGSPTVRRRLFVIARCDGAPIRWPEPTHGPGRLPYRTAAEIIDWSIPCKSIFERERPLAEATCRRIARGIQRYVIDAARPFIVPLTHQGSDRCNSIDVPLCTVTGAHRGDLAAGGTHFAEVRAFIMAYYGTNQDPRIEDPLHTVTVRDRFGLVCVDGVDYQIADIRMRMLSPRELFRAQGFPDSYIIEATYRGKPLTKTAQIGCCGNSVCPQVAESIVRANVVLEVPERKPAPVAAVAWWER
jgi:DNA (cytosine-5)-methyltransferase 1